MSNHETAGSHDDRRNLVNCPDNDIALVAILRLGLHLRRRSRSASLPGNVATSQGRLAILRDWQSDPLLCAADDTHIPLLHTHLDQGVAQAYTYRHQGRPDGEDTAEVEGEGGQDVGRGRDTLRPLMVASLRNLCRNQAGRRRGRAGGRDPADRHADCPVVGRQQFLHKSDPLRFLQQEVPARLYRHPEERPVLRQAQVLRDCRDDILLDEHEEVFLLRQQQQQQLVDETCLAWTSGPSGQQRFLHIQSYRRVIVAV